MPVQLTDSTKTSRVVSHSAIQMNATDRKLSFKAFVLVCAKWFPGPEQELECRDLVRWCCVVVWFESSASLKFQLTARIHLISFESFQTKFIFPIAQFPARLLIRNTRDYTTVGDPEK